MRHGVAGEAHAPQHQEHADGAGAERQEERTRKRPLHERVIGKGRDDEFMEAHAAAPGSHQGA